MPGSILSNCSPRVITVDESCGCTLTRATIRGMTPSDFEAQGVKETGLDKVIANAAEVRATGIPENGLEAILLGAIKQINKPVMDPRNVATQGSVILPFIYRQQRSVINSNYFKVNSGAADPAAGTGSIHPGSWQVVVGQTGSTYSTALDDLDQYFLVGRNAVIEFVAASGSGATPHFKITAVTVVGDGSTAKLTLEPNITSSGWAGLTTLEKSAWQPTGGNLVQLANNVSNYESWCAQDPSENNRKLLAFWLQTSRESHCYNDEYLKALQAPYTSEYWKKFKNLPLAEQRRRQEALARATWVNSIFYGQRINENQTPDTYYDLPTVVDPANTSCVLEYKAQALGFQTQLSDCNRVYDHAGNPLNLDLVFNVGYDLKRAREATGASVDTIDCMTDRFTYGRIMEKMIAFYKAKYGVETTRFYQSGQKLMLDNQIAFEYTVYDIPPEFGGYRLAVFTHKYFDDKLAAFATAHAGMGRTLWMIDWSDFELAIVGSQSVQRKTNVADELYRCVIDINMKYTMLKSTTWTAILADPQRSYIFKNFSDSCANLTTTVCGV
jgi:hypothetical protein